MGAVFELSADAQIAATNCKASNISRIQDKSEAEIDYRVKWMTKKNAWIVLFY